MGYTTSFEGNWTCTPALNEAQIAYLRKFNETRRMKRDSAKAALIPDPLREAVGLPIGEFGEYFVEGRGNFGQGNDDSVLEHNGSAPSQPGLWCQWIPSEDGTSIEWDEGEKFYSYVEWIEYQIEHFFQPWGIVLDGTVRWCGEESGDLGKITIKDNVVSVREFNWQMLDEPELKTYTVEEIKQIEGQSVPQLGMNG